MHPVPHALQPTSTNSLVASRASFLRRVYLLMTGAVAVAAATAASATMLGEGVTVGRGVTVPPAIFWSLQHPFLMLGALLVGSLGAGLVARRPGINLAALFGLAGLLGFVAAPTIWFAQLRASHGQALTSAPVLHAGALAVGGFVGLSAYALLSRRDFSGLGAFLSMGLFVLIGASLLNIFLGGATLSLAIASVTVLLFGGYTLYDTSRMLREGEDEPVVAALNQFLNLFNLFLALLRIFSGGRRDD